MKIKYQVREDRKGRLGSLLAWLLTIPIFVYAINVPAEKQMYILAIHIALVIIFGWVVILAEIDDSFDVEYKSVLGTCIVVVGGMITAAAFILVGIYLFLRDMFEIEDDDG